MTIEWEYGITTCMGRCGPNGLLSDTKKSLELAGFDKPVIFFDGMIDDFSVFKEEDQIAQRSKILRPFGNWMLAAWELWIRNPHANRYLIFQDDVVAVKGLKEYLDNSSFPDNAYGNLFTFPQNQKYMSKKLGWYPAEGGQGLGGLGLMFTNSAMEALLSSKHLVTRVKDPHRGWKLLDGAAHKAMADAGFKEHVHNPSLLQHTGQMKSTFQSKQKQKAHELAPSFPGTNVDINIIMEAPKVKSSQRIGFIGRHCGDEESIRNRQFCQFVDVDTWMIIPHPTKNITYPLPEWINMTACRNAGDRKMIEFVKSIDMLVFFDRDFKYYNLFRICQEQRKKVIGITESESTHIDHEHVNEWLTLSEDASVFTQISLPANPEDGEKLTELLRDSVNPL